MDQTKPPVDDRQFRRMAEAVPVPAWSAALDGSCDFVNRAWCAHTGLSAEASLGWGWLAAVHPDDHRDCAAAWTVAVQTTSPFAFELRLKRSDGTYGWFHVRAELLLDANDQPERWFGTADDIAHRTREDSHSLSHERQRLSLALDAGSLGIFEWDVTTNDMYWSPECFSVMGGAVPRYGGTRDDFARLLHPDDASRVWARVDEALAGGRPYALDFRIVKPDGSVRWLNNRGTVVRDATGRPLRIVGVVGDITERKQAEEALRESELRYRRLHDSIRDAFVVVDMEGRICESNAAYREMLGYTEDELARLTYVELTPERWHAMEARIVAEEILRTGSSGIYEKEYRRRDGSTLPIELRTYLIRDSSGAPYRMWAIVRDITERTRAEAALRESENRFRAFVQASSDVVYRMSADWSEMRHLEGKEFIADTDSPSGTWLNRYIHPDDQPQVVHAIQDAIRTKSTFELVHRVLRVDGSLGWTHSRAIPMLGPDGEILEWFGTAADVTARKHAEEALDSTRKRLEAALNASQVVLFQHDLELRYTWIHNPAFVTAHQILGKRDTQIQQHFEDGARLEAIKQSVIDTGVTCREEVCIVRDGHTHFYDLMVQPDYNADGVLTGVICAAVDMTRHKLAEDALRSSEHRYRTLLDATNALTYTCPPSGLFEGACPSWTAFTGQTVEQARGDGWLTAVHPDDVASVALGWSRAIERGVPLQIEHRVRRHDGQWRWMQLTGAPVRDSNGHILEWSCASVDITDRKMVEEELREADRRKDQFVAILAHELRNPLAPIRTSIALLKTRQLSDPMMLRSRDIIDRQIAQMARLLDDLLDVSRLSRNTLTLQRSHVLLRDVLAAAIETAIPLIEPRGHGIALEGLDDTIGLDGDAARLIQVFGNLLTNAAKYSPPHSTITVHVRIEADTAIVEVRDTGVGIAREHLESVFGLFAQIPGADPANTSGLGIGLALVRRLVDLHGGTITAASAGRGRGSTFTVRLPALRLLPTLSTHPQPVVTEVPVIKRRVLVADDNEDAADTIGLLFAELGCEVRTVYAGESALREAEAFRPEVVFLDLGMPDLDGREVCRQIRSQTWGANMMLVALTGWGRDEDRRRTRVAGFDEHIVKPADPDALVRLLREMPHARPQ
ncbi:MAG: PAS domain S-box protein [Vicinamibacterales bacterium]